MAKKNESVPHGWYCKAEMARIFGTTVRNFDATYRRHAPTDQQRDIGGRPHFHAWSLIKAWAAQAKVKPDVVGDDWMLDGGSDSQWLEECRKAKSRLLWMDVNQREKTHIPVATLEPALMSLTGVLRGAAEQLSRSHGNDAAGVLNQAIDRWEESLQELIDTDEPDPASAEADRAEHPHAAAADDARVR
jgi:hypothetical protein